MKAISITMTSPQSSFLASALSLEMIISSWLHERLATPRRQTTALRISRSATASHAYYRQAMHHARRCIVNDAATKFVVCDYCLIGTRLGHISRLFRRAGLSCRHFSLADNTLRHCRVEPIPLRRGRAWAVPDTIICASLLILT